MTGERKHPEHGVFPDMPPIFAVDEDDVEAAIGIIPAAAVEGTSSADGKKPPEAVHQENETSPPRDDGRWN